MGVELPSKVGEPANSEISHQDRFVNLAIAVEKGVKQLRSLRNSDQIWNMSDATRALDSACLPRHAGLVKISAGVVGEIDVQAADLRRDMLILKPQPKEIVNPETKAVRGESLATLTIPTRYDGVYFTIPIGYAFNPDESPWLADRFEIDSRFGQNAEGFVIARLSVLDVGRFLITTKGMDLESGLITCPRT